MFQMTMIRGNAQRTMPIKRVVAIIGRHRELPSAVVQVRVGRIGADCFI